MNYEKFLKNVLTGFSRGIGYRASRMIPTWLIVVILILAFIFQFEF